jgi:hypothetical protein
VQAHVVVRIFACLSKTFSKLWIFFASPAFCHRWIKNKEGQSWAENYKTFLPHKLCTNVAYKDVEIWLFLLPSRMFSDKTVASLRMTTLSITTVGTMTLSINDTQHNNNSRAFSDNAECHILFLIVKIDEFFKMLCLV